MKPETAARELREGTRYTQEELNLLRAAKELRQARGLYRVEYTPEEVEIVARARKIALRGGQVRLARFLVIRKLGDKKLTIVTGPGPIHRCPLCGRTHRAPKAKLTKEELAREARILEQAVREQREARS